MQAFRKRSDDARRHLNALKDQKVDVDFAYYKNTLKNQSVVSQAEKILKDFKPVTYDVGAHLKAIDAFEAKAVSATSLSSMRKPCPQADTPTNDLQVEQAQASADKIENELKDLKATLKNIEDARPFNQLTVDEIIAARPEIKETVEAMVKQGKWTTPQYQERFGSEYQAYGFREVLYAHHLAICRSVCHLDQYLVLLNWQDSNRLLALHIVTA